MFASTRSVELNLAGWPVIRHAGVNHHGRRRRRTEHYRNLGTWCVHLYRYHAKLRVDGEWYEIHPGRATLLPPNAELEYRYQGESTHACVHFSLVPNQLPSKLDEPPAVVQIPLMQELGPMFAPLNAQLEQVIATHSSKPRRASAGVLELLWRLSELRDPAGKKSASIPPLVPAVVKLALQRIELTLSKPIYVKDLAQELGFSHAHLTRLFHAATGSTIAAHVARRRAERAAELLVHTNVPIKTVAAQVGLPDLHQFNKTIRRQLGDSPRAIRGGATAKAEVLRQDRIRVTRS
jgi:AraC-like DNA-binding protein